MREEFKESFRQLSINDKRNELNNEMETVFSMLRIIKSTIGTPIDESDSIRNYHIVEDAEMSESEMLDLLYFDFYIIQKNVLDIADTIIKSHDQDDF